MREPLGAQLVRQALMPLGVLAAWVVVLFWLIASLGDTADWVDHTDRVIAEIGQLESGVLGQMAAARGYFVTAHEPYVSIYAEEGRIESSVATLQQLVSDTPPQIARVRNIAGLVGEWRKVADAEIALVRAGRSPAEMLRAEAEPLERAIRGGLLEMRLVEERLREQRVSRAA